jgi:uncharacterized protein involved in outer membrane biogenesis
MKKAVKIIGIILVVVIIAAAAIPFFFKDRIMAEIKKAANENLNATFDFKSLDISLFKGFPGIFLGLTDVSVVGKDDFKGDTLVYVKQLSVNANFWKLIASGKTEVKSILVDEPRIHLIGLKNGKVNWDITKPDKDKTTVSESSDFKFTLSRYTIRKGYITYRDDAAAMSSEIINLNHTGKGDFTQDNFVLNTMTEIDKLTFTNGGMSYLAGVKTTLKADLDIDNKNSRYTFKENELSLNEFPVNFDGFVAMPGKDITMDIKFNSPKTDFKYLMSLIPGVYKEGFKDVQSSGKMEFNGFVKGTYSDNAMPGYGINLAVDKGQFKYPSLPSSINNVNIKLAVANADGLTDHVKINLTTLHAEFGAEPFDARLHVVTPVSNATFDGMLKGTLNLANMKNFIPLEAGTHLTGIFKSDVNFAGNMQAIDQKQFEKIKADGWLALSQFVYKSKDNPADVKVNDMRMTFNPRNITLDNLDASMGKSDISAKGTIDNLPGYYFKRELLKGSFTLNSNQIDLNELMSKNTGTAATPDTTKATVAEIPENIDLALAASVGKIFYENKVIENLKGNVAMRDRTLGMNDLNFNIIGGKVVMNGLYQTKDVKSPFFNLDLSMTNFDIQKTVKTFNTVQKMAAVAERCNGSFSTSFKIDGRMDAQMEPLLQTLNGGGKLNTQSVTVTNFEPLNKLADALKMPQYKQMAVGNAAISFKFKDGRINVEPFETTMAGTKTTIQGSSGFDQTIDYDLNLAIPKAMLGSAATGVVSGLMAGLNKNIGTNLSVPDPVNIKVNMGGTVAKPEIKTALKDGAKNVIEDVKEKALEQLNAKKQELEDKAKAEADRLKKEAEDRVNTEKERLKKEADERLAKEKKDAEDKAKKAAEDKVKDLFGKPKK